MEIKFNEFTILFANFLKENNAYKPYLNALYSQKKSFFKEWYNYINPLTIKHLELRIFLCNGIGLINAFTWRETKEGHNFWKRLNNEWNKLMHEKNFKII